MTISHRREGARATSDVQWDEPPWLPEQLEIV